MQKNKFTTYLLYAIGEIVLVVIGILIAVSINNWNEDRLDLNQEKVIMKSLKIEMEKNLLDLEQNIKTLESSVEVYDYILQFTGPDYQNGAIQNYDSVISRTIGLAVWDPSTYTLNEIKNSGRLSKISNTELRDLLMDWDSFYSNLLDWGDFYVARGDKYFDYLIENAIGKNLQFSPDGSTARSKFTGSNESLLRKVEFENHLSNKTSLSHFMLLYYRDAATQLRAIIKACETYEKEP